uniref:Uncharacterized protein n=1 Tax=Plectus sambesii TaxID=2011161 RepID=A0A914WCW0_9BILA
TCAFECCASHEGADQGYFCCELKEDRTVGHLTLDERGSQGTDGNRNSENREPTPQQFVAYGSGVQIDWGLLLLGLVVSIALSVILSFLCCLLCNGCWLHRRRNPQMYESVNDSGWQPLCCGFGIPMGTVVFSTHPPQFREDGEMYHGSSSSSLPSSRNRVRFNEDGTPKGVLKNGGNGNPYFGDTV